MNSACSIVGNMLATGYPYLSQQDMQMPNIAMQQAALGNQTMHRYGGFQGILMSDLESPRQRKLLTAHEIAADVRARHPEMQVKRLGNDCAARSD